MIDIVGLLNTVLNTLEKKVRGIKSCQAIDYLNSLEAAPPPKLHVIGLI